MKKHGRTRKAVMEAIRICKDRNVLSEYLSSKESEVVSIMMGLYDEDGDLVAYRTFTRKGKDADIPQIYNMDEPL